MVGRWLCQQALSVRVCAHVPFVLPAMCSGMYLKVKERYMRLQRGDIGPLVALDPKGQHDTVNFEFIILSGVCILFVYSDYCCIRFSCIYDRIKITFKLVTV